MNKTVASLFASALLVSPFPVAACPGVGILKIYRPLSYALDVYTDTGKRIDEYLEKQFPNAEFVPVRTELEIVAPVEIHTVRSGSIFVKLPLRSSPDSNVQFEHIHVFVQAEYKSCEARDAKQPLSCRQNIAYRKIASFQPTPELRQVGFQLTNLENMLTTIVVAVQRDQKTGKVQHLLAYRKTTRPHCGPGEEVAYIKDQSLRDSLNRHEYNLNRENILYLHNQSSRFKKKSLSYSEYLQYIEGEPLVVGE